MGFQYSQEVLDNVEKELGVVGLFARFEDVRKWGRIRGLDGAAFQIQYQRFLQELVEVHEAYTFDSYVELQDAIGDTFVTLVNLAKTFGERAEDCVCMMEIDTLSDRPEEFHQQYQYILRDAVDIHNQWNLDNMADVQSAIGAVIIGLLEMAEDFTQGGMICMNQAFGEIEFRKGLNIGGDFIRYAKLTDDEKDLCDDVQGSPGKDHYDGSLVLDFSHFDKSSL